MSGAALTRVIRGLPDGAVVLLDGLIASPAPEALVPHARRLRQVVLMHMPLGDGRERDVLEAATAVVTTSEWTRRRLEELYALQRVHVAEPGVDPADLAPGSAAGDALLCVAPVTRDKGHDVLLDALAGAGLVALHVRGQPGARRRRSRTRCAGARTTGCASPGR